MVPDHKLVCSTTPQHQQPESGLPDGEGSTIVQRQEAEIGAILVDAARVPLYLIRTFRERGDIQQASRESLPAISWFEGCKGRHHLRAGLGNLLIPALPQIIPYILQQFRIKINHFSSLVRSKLPASCSF